MQASAAPAEGTIRKHDCDGSLRTRDAPRRCKRSLPNEAMLRILKEHRVPAAPVMSVVDTVRHAHFKTRNMIRIVPDPLLGEVMIPGFPLKFSVAQAARDPGAALGEHGAEALREQLGIHDAEIAELRSHGVLYSENK